MRCCCWRRWPAWAPPRSDVADAVMRGDTAAVRALLAQKADVNATQADGATALHWAVYREDLAPADLLIQAGANVEGGQPRRRHAALAGGVERRRSHDREPAEGGRGPERARCRAERRR